MKFLLAVVGMVMFIEGLPYFLFPERTQRLMAEIQEMSPRVLRGLGLVLLVLGLIITYFSNGID